MNKIMYRIDRKQLIKQLQALQDNFIELWLDLTNKSYLTVKDSNNINQLRTKN